MNYRHSDRICFNRFHGFKFFIIALLLFSPIVLHSINAQTDSTLKIFQFPSDKIPRIDGNTDDWGMVPKEYIIGNDQLRDDEKKHATLDTNNLNVKVRVGWVKVSCPEIGLQKK